MENESEQVIESNSSEQKVQELKKEESKDFSFKINPLYAGIALFVLIIAFTSYFYFITPQENYTFIEERNNVIFQSNSNPKQLLTEFISNENFVLIAQLQEEGGVNQDMISSAILLNSIFTYNEKKTVLLFEVLDSDSKELLSCETNKGNVLEGVTLTKEECIQYLTELSLPEIKVLFPGAEDGKVKVLLEPNKFTIKTSSPKSAEIASSVLLELLFEGNADALNKINDLSSQIYS
ncbi:MAG: hypothetical protein JW703_02055 [Candidatus Diapherotrites archaeon]|nr:hypothetical protein [Candidatus Diapherotrites archaeon]